MTTSVIGSDRMLLMLKIMSGYQHVTNTIQYESLITIGKSTDDLSNLSI